MELYSKEYIHQLKELHSRKDRPRGFGGKVKSLGQFDTFYKKWMPASGLDYGCGKGAILNYLREVYDSTLWSGYDPAVKSFDLILQKSFDCVFCNDVLEHIEPKFLDNVLDHIFELSKKYIWLRIDTLPARKTLLDGRNAHLIIEPQSWWIEKLNSKKGDIVYHFLDKKGKLDVAIVLP